METLCPAGSETDDYQPLGLDQERVDRLATEILETISWSADGGQSAGALYFQHRRPAGGWLIQGLGQHPAGGGFLVYDFPQLDDPAIFFSRSETVYLPALCPPLEARGLVGRIFDDRRPDLRPLIDLPDLLCQPEANRVRYRELTDAVKAGIDRTRTRLEALGCQLPNRRPAGRAHQIAPDPGPCSWLSF